MTFNSNICHLPFAICDQMKNIQSQKHFHHADNVKWMKAWIIFNSLFSTSTSVIGCHKILIERIKFITNGRMFAFFSVDVVVIIAAWCYSFLFSCRLRSSVSFCLNCFCICRKFKGTCYRHAFLWCKRRQYKYHKIVNETTNNEERDEDDEDDENEVKRHRNTRYFHLSLLFDAHDS